MCRKFVCGAALTALSKPPVHLTVMPWWVMFWVWLTVTCRFLKSGYMNDSGLVGLALDRSEFGLSSLPGVLIGWFCAFRSPSVQLTVRAEEVVPTPVIWL